MTWWGIDDLRGYMKDAVLPELKHGANDIAFPPSGHKSHRNTLSTRFRKERHLTSIQCLDDAFDNLVNNCQLRHHVFNMRRLLTPLIRLRDYGKCTRYIPRLELTRSRRANRGSFDCALSSKIQNKSDSACASNRI